MPHLHLAIIVYDVADNRRRARLAACLEERMTRVQESVFEGWMTGAEARSLGADAAALIGSEDSLRLYIVPRSATGACAAWGFPPVATDDGALVV